MGRGWWGQGRERQGRARRAGKEGSGRASTEQKGLLTRIIMLISVMVLHVWLRRVTRASKVTMARFRDDLGCCAALPSGLNQLRARSRCSTIRKGTGPGKRPARWAVTGV